MVEITKIMLTRLSTFVSVEIKSEVVHGVFTKNQFFLYCIPRCSQCLADFDVFFLILDYWLDLWDVCKFLARKNCMNLRILYHIYSFHLPFSLLNVHWRFQKFNILSKIILLQNYFLVKQCIVGKIQLGI